MIWFQKVYQSIRLSPNLHDVELVKIVEYNVVVILDGNTNQ